MKLRASGSARVLVLALAAFGALACSDSLPTDTPNTQTIQFTLSDDAARAFGEAIGDVRDRILPVLASSDPDHTLAPLMDELSTALAERDQGKLHRALARTESALAQLQRGEAAAEIGSDVDAVRLILDQARPLADGVSPTRQ